MVTERFTWTPCPRHVVVCCTPAMRQGPGAGRGLAGLPLRLSATASTCVAPNAATARHLSPPSELNGKAGRCVACSFRIRLGGTWVACGLLDPSSAASDCLVGHGLAGVHFRRPITTAGSARDAALFTPETEPAAEAEVEVEVQVAAELPAPPSLPPSTTPSPLA